MEFLVWLESTTLADIVRTVPWVYPALESLHYVGIAFLVGGIMLIDLRVLGLAPSLPLRTMMGLIPWVWAGFVINAITGTAMFIYGATGFGTNGAFLVKMTLIVLAGINALIFQIASTRRGSDWVTTGAVPLHVKTVATLSFGLWLAVVTTGRWMAYI